MIIGCISSVIELVALYEDFGMMVGCPLINWVDKVVFVMFGIVRDFGYLFSFLLCESLVASHSFLV